MPDQPPSTNTASEALAKAMAASYGASIVPPEALPSPDAARQANEPTPQVVAPEPTPVTPAAAPTKTPAGTPTATPEPTPAATPEPTPAAPPEPTPAATPEPTPAAATGATAAAPAEPKLTDDQLDAAQKKMTVAAGTAFKAVRTENKQLEAQISDLQAKLDAASKTPPVTNEEFEAIRKENAAYKERLAAVDYQNSDEYQTKISKPLEVVDATLKALATKYSVDAAALRAALAEPDVAKRSDQLSELSASFNRLDMQRFDSSVVDHDRLNAEKRQVLQNAFQKQEEERRQIETARVQTARNLQESWKASLTNSLNKLTAESPIFAKTEDEAWDKAMSDAVARVQAVDLGRIPTDELARALYRSEALGMALNLVTDLVKKNSEQDAVITKLRGATPKAGGGTVPTAPVSPPGPTGGASFIQVAREKLGGILPP
jgi:hypothetical protein